jgi:hypothetical protein
MKRKQGFFLDLIQESVTKNIKKKINFSGRKYWYEEKKLKGCPEIMM